MKNIKKSDIKQEWHKIDANSQILGRLSTNAAHLLMGKNKAYYTPNLDCGDFVVVINAGKIVLSGKKETQKTYFHHSGYPGGMKTRTPEILRLKKPEEIIRHAISGMLPKSKLGKIMIKKLYIYATDKNPHESKFKN